MYRFLSITVVLVLALSTGASADGTSIHESSGGVVVTAGSPESLTLDTVPGRPGTGPTIYCGWFQFTGGFGSQVFYLVGDPISPHVGVVYGLNCWTSERDDPYPGYPIIKQYHGSREIPGEPVSTGEAALFAIAHINFEVPEIELSPPGRQVVGVPSWLAVTSRLRYDEVSANAGPVWATAWALFRDVTWDFGNTDPPLDCRQDVAKVWDPTTNQPQTSRCTHTYTNSSGSPFDVTATIHWNIWQQTNTNPSWHWWGTISRSTTIPVQVTQLQSAIR